MESSTNETVSEQELTSNSSVLSTSCKADKNDATPTSSTDAYTNNDDSIAVSDDPISSTSSDPKEPKTSKMCAVIDSDVELFEMGGMPSEKITEDVEDLVHDLESLLGESTESFNLSNIRKGFNKEVKKEAKIDCVDDKTEPDSQIVIEEAEQVNQETVPVLVNEFIDEPKEKDIAVQGDIEIEEKTKVDISEVETDEVAKAESLVQEKAIEPLVEKPEEENEVIEAKADSGDPPEDLSCNEMSMEDEVKKRKVVIEVDAHLEGPSKDSVNTESSMENDTTIETEPKEQKEAIEVKAEDSVSTEPSTENEATIEAEPKEPKEVFEMEANLEGPSKDSVNKESSTEDKTTIKVEAKEEKEVIDIEADLEVPSVVSVFNEPSTESEASLKEETSQTESEVVMVALIETEEKKPEAMVEDVKISEGELEQANIAEVVHETVVDKIDEPSCQVKESTVSDIQDSENVAIDVDVGRPQENAITNEASTEEVAAEKLVIETPQEQVDKDATPQQQIVKDTIEQDEEQTQRDTCRKETCPVKIIDVESEEANTTVIDEIYPIIDIADAVVEDEATPKPQLDLGIAIEPIADMDRDDKCQKQDIAKTAPKTTTKETSTINQQLQTVCSAEPHQEASLVTSQETTDAEEAEENDNLEASVDETLVESKRKPKAVEEPEESSTVSESQQVIGVGEPSIDAENVTEIAAGIECDKAVQGEDVDKMESENEIVAEGEQDVEKQEKNAQIQVVESEVNVPGEIVEEAEPLQHVEETNSIDNKVRSCTAGEVEPCNIITNPEEVVLIQAESNLEAATTEIIPPLAEELKEEGKAVADSSEGSKEACAMDNKQVRSLFDTPNSSEASSPVVPETASTTYLENQEDNLETARAVESICDDQSDDQQSVLPDTSTLEENKNQEPLTINVEESPKAPKPFSPKLTIKPVKVPDEEAISTTSNVDIENREPLKMTITKQSDKMHSILKIYNPNEAIDEVEAAPPEQTVPKLIIKKPDQQSSPKMSTRSCTSSTVSPLKITIKTPLKNDDIKQKHSPKLIIKPVVKTDDDSPKLNIKPIKPPPAEEPEQVHSPKIRIKPIPKPEEVVELQQQQQQQHTPRLNIKPIVDCPKVTIKPVIKPPEPDVVKNDEEEVKERIVLKINKGNLATPQKELRKRDHSEDKSEKLKKIKLKFSKEGGHPHIVPEVANKRSYDEDGGVEEKTKKIKATGDGEDVDRVKNEVIVSEENNVVSLKEEVAQVAPQQPQFEPVIQPIIQAAPSAPRKRGRPRKVPIEQRAELPPETAQETPKLNPNQENSAKTQSAADAPPHDSGRPKRSCRGQNARVALGIKPRKPRGASRARGQTRGTGTRTVPMKAEKETKLSKARLRLLEKSAKELLTQKTTDDCIGPLSEFSNFRVPSSSSSGGGVDLEATSSNEVSSSQTLDDPPSGSVSDASNPDGKPLSLSNTELVMFEEETRMSADSRAQTPAKQVITATPMEVEESQSSIQSTATVESGKTPTSKAVKVSRLEVHHDPDQNIISAEQLAEYHWNGNGPFMLQEQVAQFLGIKSFKRKYPNIARRFVDMQERDFIRESCLASEAMCDMGLTAVCCADILDIMYSDFQDKYEEYCKHQRDRQTKELINKHKAMNLAATQEKNKLDITEQAVQSAASWNANFNKTRREQRKAAMDLQTWTVHYPKNKMKHLTKGKIGNYPVALVPGQFTDFYQEYTPTEINNLPINTMCYDPINLPESEESDSSSSDSDSESSSGSSSSGSCSGDEDCKLCLKQQMMQQQTGKITAAK